MKPLSTLLSCYSSRFLCLNIYNLCRYWEIVQVYNFIKKLFLVSNTIKISLQRFFFKETHLTLCLIKISSLTYRHTEGREQIFPGDEVFISDPNILIPFTSDYIEDIDWLKGFHAVQVKIIMYKVPPTFTRVTLISVSFNSGIKIKLPISSRKYAALALLVDLKLIFVSQTLDFRKVYSILKKTFPDN